MRAGIIRKNRDLLEIVTAPRDQAIQGKGQQEMPPTNEAKEIDTETEMKRSVPLHTPATEMDQTSSEGTMDTAIATVDSNIIMTEPGTCSAEASMQRAKEYKEEKEAPALSTKK